MSIRQRWVAVGLLSLVLASLGVTARARVLIAASDYWRPPAKLELPVEGLRREQVVSSWNAPRSGGRRHEGIDLFAQRGTAVRSATRGVVWKVGQDSLGGNVVTVLGDGPAFYYYAHLDRFAEGLRTGERIDAGTKLGTVGNTGNARTTPPHLHFGVYRVGTFRTRAVDPAALLRRRSR